MRSSAPIALLCALIALAPNSHAAWHAIMVSGDNSIDNFDNSRTELGRLFAQRGLLVQNQHHLSSLFPDSVNSDNSIASLTGLTRNLTQLNINPKQDACLFYVSSHGKRDDGVYLKRAYGQGITPEQLNTALNWTCGNAPTVVMVSACYSGQFIAPLQANNRIILTAASTNRPSFGCSEDLQYTFWDGCVIENLPQSPTWEALFGKVKQCIARKEQALNYPASLPQAYFGKNVRDLPLQFH